MDESKNNRSRGRGSTNTQDNRPLSPWERVRVRDKKTQNNRPLSPWERVRVRDKKTQNNRPLSLRERARVRANKTLLSRARSLRRNSTEAELRLWNHLRNRQLEGFKFRRQVIIKEYIVDFVCLEAKLIIEADGGQHTKQKQYDAKRTAILEDHGFRILRFWNHEILDQKQDVLERIRLELTISKAET